MAETRLRGSVTSGTRGVERGSSQTNSPRLSDNIKDCFTFENTLCNLPKKSRHDKNRSRINSTAKGPGVPETGPRPGLQGGALELAQAKADRPTYKSKTVYGFCPQ